MIAVYHHRYQDLVPFPELLLYHEADRGVEVIVFAQDAILHRLSGASANDVVLPSPPVVDVSTDHVASLVIYFYQSELDQSEAYPGGDEPSEGELIHSCLLSSECSFAWIHTFKMFITIHFCMKIQPFSSSIPFVLTEQSEYSILSSAK